MGIARFGARLRRQAVRVVAARGDRAEIAFTGDITADLAFRIEQIFQEQIERGVREWDIDLRRARHLDMTCAFALLRPVLSLSPEPATVRIRGAAGQVRQVLHQIGADRFFAFED